MDEDLAARRTMNQTSRVAPSLCPACGHPGRRLPAEAWMDYHYCDDCHAAWLIDRRHRQPLPVLMAIPKKDRRKPEPTAD